MSNKKENKEKIVKKEQKGTKKKRTGLKIFLVILLIIAVAVGIFIYKTQKNGGGLQGVLKTTLGHDNETVNTLPKINCVLLGQSQNLTDTIMLASYDPKTGKASLLSIPRDTFIGEDKNEAEPLDKINALCQYYYPDKTTAAVSEITGIDVDKYILIDTKVLVELVDALGGVYFDVPIDMNYDSYSQGLHINLKKGYQLLDGESAEELVRFRHNNDGTTYPESYGVEDIGRMRTQREFLTAVAKQTLKAENILKIGEFIDLYFNNVKTNFTIDEVKDYLPYIVNFDTANLKTNTLPGVNELCNGTYVYIVDEEETQKVVDELFNDKVIAEDEAIPSDIRIEVLNGSGTSKALTELTTELQEAGYNVVKTGETSTTAKTTIINRTNQTQSTTDSLQEIIGTGASSTGEDTNNVDYTIIIGKDY